MQVDLMKLMIAGLALPIIGMSLISGCGDAAKARVDVAKKRLVEQLDDRHALHVEAEPSQSVRP
jgi:hypothetical protein